MNHTSGMMPQWNLIHHIRWKNGCIINLLTTMPDSWCPVAKQARSHCQLDNAAINIEGNTPNVIPWNMVHPYQNDHLSILKPQIIAVLQNHKALPVFIPAGWVSFDSLTAPVFTLTSPTVPGAQTAYGGSEFFPQPPHYRCETHPTAPAPFPS